ncbi:RABGGTA [Acanthosepion pharaonis]|uniref:Geranylgeranyl transferase type-2 subunit alpha n=1 Tax=Acanthosepion pharaonis TaxID=158019 RepID=A0A812E6R5_ACAPH|nr:RABGGTA [Sepia pharaonis]
MHGRVKVRTVAEQAEAKKKEKEKKLQAYNAALEKIFEKRNNQILDEEGLKLSLEVLLANPDFYTLWNFRKDIFFSLKESRPTEELQKLYEEELHFIESCLRVNPKSYGTWDHRTFVMNNIPQADWKRELFLCNKFLEYDERNFHCWDYRRFVVKNSTNITIQDEFDFTTDKISSNFSNYSSWHYRSKLLPLLQPDPEQPAGVKEEALLKEFEIVQNAIFTDPDDQSAWFYHKWLLGRGEIKLDLLHVVIIRKSKRVVVNVTKPIHLVDTPYKIQLEVNGNTITDKWQNPFDTNLHSPVWIMLLPDGIMSTDDTMEISVKLLNDSETISSCLLTMKSSMKQASYHSTTVKPAAIFSSELTAAKSAILEQELQSIQELLELETENKWAILTVVQLMKSLDSIRYATEIKNNLEKLQSIDPKRERYYNDFGSKIVIENQIKTMDPLESMLQLNNLSLTAAYHMEYLLILQDLDVSHNHITNVKNFAYLQCLEVLNLDDNQLDNVDGLEFLPSIVSISLRRNFLANLEVLRPLQRCKTLVMLCLDGNPLFASSGMPHMFVCLSSIQMSIIPKNFP